MISSLQRFGACLNPCNCRSRERVDDVAPPGGRPRDGGLLCDGCRPWQRPGTIDRALLSLKHPPRFALVYGLGTNLKAALISGGVNCTESLLFYRRNDSV
jgi:hypothetical protein